ARHRPPGASGRRLAPPWRAAAGDGAAAAPRARCVAVGEGAPRLRRRDLVRGVVHQGGKEPSSGIAGTPLEPMEACSVLEGHDYTIYSNGPAGRSRMYAFLALITAFLTPLVQHGGLVLLRRFGGVAADPPDHPEDWDVTKAALFFGGFTALILYAILINVFNSYLWRMTVGLWMFRLIDLPAPPNLNGEYRGAIELYSAT